MSRRLSDELCVLVGYLTVVTAAVLLVHFSRSESSSQLALRDALVPALLLFIRRASPPKKRG